MTQNDARLGREPSLNNGFININNIFDIDRSGQNNLVESDQSFTLGFEYEKINKKNNVTFLNLGLAAVFREDKNFLEGLNVFKGQVTYKAVAETFGYKYISPNDLIS